MKTIFSTAYFAPIQYYIEYLNSKNPYLEVYENYTKQTYRNRCSIMGANNKLNLIIPIKKVKNSQKIICNIEIDNNQNWQKLHWKSIEIAYRTSPYFEFYEDVFRPFYSKKYLNLLDINNDCHLLICKILKINKKFLKSKSFNNNYNVDLRNQINPKRDTLKKNKKYIQVFSDKIGFIPNLSIIDLIFNLGPESIQYLKNK